VHGLQAYRPICCYFYVFYVFLRFFKIQKNVTFYVFFAVFHTFSRTMTATAARARMTEDRLEALVMVNTHRRLTPDCDVITRFAETDARRINFVV